MSIQADAIYEGGVLRPLAPLNLAEHEVVSLSISQAKPEAANDEATRQHAVLMAYVTKVESQPDSAPQDSLSNRDHDRLIYGN